MIFTQKPLPEQPHSFIADDMAATGLLFVKFLQARGMALVDELGDPIPQRVLEREGQRFAMGER